MLLIRCCFFFFCRCRWENHRKPMRRIRTLICFYFISHTDGSKINLQPNVREVPHSLAEFYTILTATLTNNRCVCSVLFFFSLFLFLSSFISHEHAICFSFAASCLFRFYFYSFRWSLCCCCCCGKGKQMEKWYIEDANDISLCAFSR